MSEPALHEEVARLEAELAGLVADAHTELDPGDRAQMAALAARCDVILGLLQRLQATATGADGA
jgi:hypothetical protein